MQANLYLTPSLGVWYTTYQRYLEKAVYCPLINGWGQEDEKMAGLQKQKIHWAVSLFLMMLYFSSLTAQAQYGGGTGEPNDPYQIATAEDLILLGDSP